MSPRDVNYNEFMQIIAEPVSYVSNQIQQEIQWVAEIEQQIEWEQQQMEKEALEKEALEKEALEKEAFAIWKNNEEIKRENERMKQKIIVLNQQLIRQEWEMKVLVSLTSLMCGIAMGLFVHSITNE